MEIKPIKAVGNRQLACLILFGITLCFASVNLLETDTLNCLKDMKSTGDLLATVPGAFHRYLFFLAISFVSGISIIWLDSDLRKLTKLNVILIASVLGLCLSWIAVSRVLQFPLCGDDSYIDFRYVRNWVQGVSFDYNPGERVIGFTSHLHLFILYIGKLIFTNASIDLIAQMLNVLFQFLNLGLLYFFLKDLMHKHAQVLAGIFAYAFDPFGIHQTMFGKETHILVCFLILSIWAMHRKRYHWLAWLSTLMPFIRPEAIVWWVITLAWSIKEKRREAIKFYIGPLAFVAFVLSAIYIYFETVIPHGMIGKFKMYYPNPLGLMFARVFRTIGTSIFLPRYFLSDNLYLPYQSIFFFSSIACGFITILLSLKVFKNSVIKWYLFAVIGFLFVYGVRNPVSFSWYHCWYLLLPVFLLAVIIPNLISFVRDSSKNRAKRVLAASALTYLIAIQLLQQVVIPVPNLTSFAFRLDSEFHRVAQLGRAYRKIASYPGFATATLGAPEIGYLGYIHQGKILDFCGLVSPEIVKVGPLPLSFRDKEQREVFEINPVSVEKFRPDYIITLEIFARELVKDKFFKKNYREIAWLENNWFQSKGINVYKLIEKTGKTK